MTTIAAYTIGGITRPELHLDPSGHIVLDPAAQAFANTYGLEYLYLGCPPGTLWPPVAGSLSTPIDANSGANTVVEGAAANTSVNLTAQATSLAGLPVTYSLAADSSSGGFKVDANTGIVTVADPSKVDFESSGGSYTVNVQATDGIFTSTQSFTIAVSNAPPVTPTDHNATANAVNEGAAVGTLVGITAFSTDVNGPGVTYSLTVDTSHGGFKIDPNTGIVTVADSSKVDFETAPGHAYSITVQASDGHGGLSSQNFVINVNDVTIGAPGDSNAAANSVFEGAAAGTTVGLTASAIDPNGPASTYALIGDTSGGGFTINAATGVVTVADPTKLDFESAAGHAYSVTVQATNGATVTSQSFSIAVGDVAPSTPVDSNGGANTITEGAANGSTVGITASSSDVNGGAVTYSLAGDTSGGGFTINAATGVVTIADSTKIDYETAPGHAYTVTAQASDGTLSSSQTFTIAVSDVAPSTPVDTNAGANTVVEGAAIGSTVGITASSTDVNGPGVTYSIVGDTSGGGFTINSATGVVTVADSTKIDYESSPGHVHTITVQASDGTLPTTQTFTIAVTDAAPATPTDSDASANSVAEGAANGSTVGVTASSLDPNGPAVTWSLVGDTSGGGFTINASTGVVTVADSTKIDYETAAGHAYTVTAQASDGQGGVSTQAFAIAVANVAPSNPVDSNAAANTVTEGAANGSTVGITASATDVNGPAVTWSLVGDTSGGGFTINAATGVVTIADSTKIDYETAPGHAYNITAQASDGTQTSSQIFAIAVSDVAPSTPVDSDAGTNTVVEGAAVGTSVGVTASATDVNGPAVTYSIASGDDSSNGGFAVDHNTGVITVADPSKLDYESAPGHAYTVKVTTSDGTLTSSQTFTIGVSDAPPSTPVDGDAAANTIVEGAANGSTVGITAAATDVNGAGVAGLTYSLVGDTSGGGFAIDHNTGVITVADSTKIDFESSGGSYTVVAQSSDGTLTGSQAFVIAVTDVAPSTPVDSNGAANQVAVSAPVGASVGITASSTDVNGPNVIYSIVPGTDTSGGAFTIDPNTGVVTVADPSKINPADSSYDIKVDSSDGTLHSQQTFTIAVVTDLAPVVTAGHTLNYTENQAATAFDPAITVTDADNANLDHATVHITGGYVNGEDVLGFTNQNGITGAFDAATGTLTLSGVSSVANYQTALASVTYFNTSDNPSGAARTVTVITNDGTLDSTAVTDTINVTPVNDPPVVTAGHSLNYTENQAATAFDPLLTVSDVDNTNLASATVQITSNYANGQDVLAFTNQNGITGAFNAGTGTLTLSGSATVAQYQAALASITYVNTSENPSGLDRTVTIITNDGAANSVAKTDTIHVTPVNDAPVTTAGGALNYTENQVATAIDASVTVSDVDSANLSSATVVIANNYVNGEDLLSFTTQNGITGAFNAATGTLTLSGSATVAQYQTALESVKYTNTSDNPSGLDRTVSYTVNDGALNSNTSTSTIHVTPVNDAPVVTFGAITNFSEPPNGTPAANSVPVTIAPSLAISDVDSSNLTGATFVLNDLKPSDVLSISGHAGTSGDIGNIHFDISNTAGTETVTLTGTDTLAHYNAVLDSIQFNNTSENPDTTARSYTVTTTDDSGTATNTSAAVSANQTVTAVNDAPTATVPAAASVGTAFSHTNLAISGLSVADIDAGSGNVTATISTLHAGLTFDTTGLAGSGGIGTHTVTLTGTTAQVNTALATLTYNSDDGFTGTDTVTLNVNDNGHTGTPGAQTSGNQTVNVGVVPQVFFIDGSNAQAGTGDGTAGNPFHTIAAFNTANPAASGDYVVLKSGTYTEANGIDLAPGVNLVGGSHSLSFVNPVTGVTVVANTASGTDPVIKVTGADDGVDLGSGGHTITGVSIDTSGGTGMGISDHGNNVGTVTMQDVVIKTASGDGMNFTHGGTITLTGTGNTITTTTGTALDVENTTIGAANLTFQSISATGSSGNAGIILDGTGSSGGLHVTGTGAAGSGGTINNKTGGDILTGSDAGGQSTSGNGGTGIYLHNTSNVSLTDMALHDFSNFAIYGNGVTNFTFTGGTISGVNGTTLAGDREESSIRFDNLLGTSSISNSSISGGYNQNIDLYNTSGTLARLTMDSDTFGLINGTGGNDNVRGQVYNSATANYTLTNSTFAGTRADFIAFVANNNASMDAVVRGNTFHNGQTIIPGGGSLVHIASGSGGFASAATTTYDISDNTALNTGADAANAFDTVGIFVAKGEDNGTMSGTIAGNHIGPAQANKNADGIFVRSAGNGTDTVLIQNNTLTGYGNVGIHLQNNDGSSTMNASLFGNVLSNPNSQNFAGIFADNGATASDTSTMNLVMGSANAGETAKQNTLAGSGVAIDVSLSNNTNSHFNLSKNGSSSSTPTGIVQDDNVGTPTVDTSGGAGPINPVNTVPPLPAVVAPLLAEAGGVQAATPNAGEMHLTQAELNSVVAAAIAQWASAGATSAQLAALQAVTFSVANLSGQILGQESAGHITIDIDAAGHGWFIDPTPSNNAEFTHSLNAAGTDLLTDPTMAAAGHIDLLTTVAHELGHVLGLPDTISPSNADGLMHIGLADGERRLPTAADVAQANSTPQNFTFVQNDAPATHQAASVPPAAPATSHGFDFSAFVQTQPQADATPIVQHAAATLSDLFSGQSGASPAWWVGHEAQAIAMGLPMPDSHAASVHHDLIV